MAILANILGQEDQIPANVLIIKNPEDPREEIKLTPYSSTTLPFDKGQLDMLFTINDGEKRSGTLRVKVMRIYDDETREWNYSNRTVGKVGDDTIANTIRKQFEAYHLPYSEYRYHDDWEYFHNLGRTENFERTGFLFSPISEKHTQSLRSYTYDYGKSLLKVPFNTYTMDRNWSSQRSPWKEIRIVTKDLGKPNAQEFQYTILRK